MKFEIKHRVSGAILFSIETDSWKLAIEAAIKGYADLRYANLRSADLRYANLRYADLSYADLSSADLSSANLRSANLRSANLRSADLSYADLSSADLRYADLSYANLRYAEGISRYLCTPLLMLLDQPGKIRAYKLVNSEGYGPFHGGLKYEVGGSIEVGDADTDETEQCGAGINLATLDWCMKEWKEGYRILVVEFEAADIAAIPTATDGKFRVRRCSVVAEKDLAEIGLVKVEEEAKAS